jgi:hypothetical protein
LINPDLAEAKKVENSAAIAVMISASQCGKARELGLAWTESSPQNSAAWEGLGDANRCLGKTWEAVRAYRRYAALGGPDAAVARRADALAENLGRLEIKVERDAFPARPEIEVRVGGQRVAPLSEVEWYRFADLRPGELINIRIGGPGFELTDFVEDPLLSRESRVAEPDIVWVGTGRIELAPSSRGDLKVEVLGGFRRVELQYGEPRLVTTGVQRLLLTTSEGRREVDVVIPRAGLLHFDPAAHLPAEVLLSRLPAGSRVRLFVEGAADEPVMHELVLPDREGAVTVDETTGVWVAPAQRVGSLVGGRGGLFVSHPVLGSGSLDITLSPGESAAFVFDPETLEGTAAVKEAYRAWLDSKASFQRRVQDPRKFGIAMLIGGAATAGVLGALAAGLPASSLGEATLAAKDAASRADAGGIELAWADYERAVSLRRGLATASGVSAGVGLVSFSLGFGLAKSRGATLLPDWQPWQRKVEP